MHQQGTTNKTCGATSGVLPGITTLFLLLLFLRGIATLLAVALLLAVSTTVSALLLTIALLSVSSLLTVAALLSVAALALVTGARIFESALTGLLVHEEPSVVTGVPLGVPWRGDRWGTLLLAVLLLLPAVLALACEVANNAVKKAHVVCTVE